MERYFTREQAAKYCGFTSIRALKEYEKRANDFPDPIELSKVNLRYDRIELDEFMEKRKRVTCGKEQTGS